METILKKSAEEIHVQTNNWMKNLAFYHEELTIFQRRLEEIAKKNNSQDIHVSIEQFQNKFIIQEHEIKTLEHLIRHSEELAVETVKTNMRRLDDEGSRQYLQVQDSYTQFETLYDELKKDFYTFLCRWM
ncbi:MAG: hypothetical protein JWO58_225 [Chitinophagaceae bacterium]|nr:hypothetical protein [Chitinophagaceae bacterium]